VTVCRQSLVLQESQSQGNKTKDEEDADRVASKLSSKRVRFDSQVDGSQADSVVTQISARRSLMREVDSKDSAGVVDMNEDDCDVDTEDGTGKDGEVEEGAPYDYDEGDEYYEEY
jgi:hypothetical protein